jgi:hypothetical protein
MGTIAAAVVAAPLVDGVVDAAVDVDAAVVVAATVAVVSAALLESELHATTATRAESDNSVGRAGKRFIDDSPVRFGAPRRRL